jgi:hypothetical protein
LAGGDGVDPDGVGAAGKGGTQVGPGAAGTGNGVKGQPGDLLTGGQGIAGGGGGFWGGGGSSSTGPPTFTLAGGGGGSGFTDTGGTGVSSMKNGVQAGNGLVTITYEAPVTGVGGPPSPTSENQCKRDGWKNFPQFKNQGQCVSFVENGK